jgi:F-type H+-transporting ATPase subunit a
LKSKDKRSEFISYMPTQLAFTRFLNHHFAAQVDSLLGALRVHPAHPSAPISNAFAMELLVFAGLLVYFVVVRATLSVEQPATIQHVAEMTHEFIGSQSESIIGHGTSVLPPT